MITTSTRDFTDRTQQQMAEQQIAAELPRKASVLGIGVSISDYRRAVEAITTAANARQAVRVTALAVHGVMCGVLDRSHRWRLNQFDMVLPDGQPVRWALNILHGARLADRVYGPNLTLQLCQRAAEMKLPVYFYGSRPEVLEQLIARLRARFPALEVAGARPSLFRRSNEDERRAINEEIANSGARIIFVGLGCPRQEVWVYENAAALGVPVVAVGAAFDFHAGLLPQAPPALQARGLEWAYRLYQEPRRLWQRYLLLNPLFATLFLAQWCGLSRFSDKGDPPAHMEYFG